ncbi:MAG: hypothetical protein IKS37_01440 [Solobacterium sp.]|nr:hypothetical protein [Solobacterium sp.]
MYEKLTEYLPKFEGLEYGRWIYDHENDGTLEHPIRMPFVNYHSAVTDFMEAVYKFVNEHPELNLTEYQEILNVRGISWGIESMKNADASSLDGQTVMALILGAIRADRFSEGTLLVFFKDGFISQWLFRLKEIDEESEGDHSK